MPIKTKTRKINAAAKTSHNGELELQASLSFEAGENEEPAKINILANNGDPMDVGLEWPLVLDFKGFKTRSAKTPIIMDHDTSLRVGHSTSIDRSDGLRVKGIVSSTSQSAVEFVADSKLGFPWQASVGASISDVQELPEGKSKTVNGKPVVGPMLIARSTVLNEVSVTTLGADSKTSAIAAKFKGKKPMATATKSRKTKKNPAKMANAKLSRMKKPPVKDTDEIELSKDDLAEVDGFQDHIENVLLMSWDDTSEETLIALFAHFDVDGEDDDDDSDPVPVKKTVKAKRSAKKDDPDDDDTDTDDDDDDSDEIQLSRQRRAKDHKRIAGIEARMEDMKSEGITVAAELVSKAIESGMSANDFELKARRASRGNGVIKSSKPPSKEDGLVLECALARQICAGQEWVEKAYKERILEASDKQEYKGIGLHYILDLSIKAAGMHYEGSRRTNAYIRCAMQATRQIKASGFSTLAITNILENVANKSLIASYEAQATAWQEIAAVRNLNDFKVHSRYMLDATGSYRKISADGELKHVSLTDSKYTLQGDTYGAIIELTRQDIINDDLNAFEQIPTKLGMMAAIRIEEAVMVLLLSNPGSFFSTGNKNIITGGPALSITSLNAAVLKFQNQVGTNGKPILGVPTILLHGTANATIAGQLFKDTNIAFGGGDTTVGGQFITNPHTGKFRPVGSPYLNNTSITDENGAAISGQSATKYYLFMNPQIRAALNVGFLNGNRTPIIESSEVDFDRLGMAWRSYHDWGVGVEDPKAALLDAGA